LPQGARHRQIEVNHNLNRHRAKARELLTSEEGVLHRSRRPIEPEAGFGQMKFNKAYNRFRHFGQDKVMMDFAIFAIAFALLKMSRTKPKSGENTPIRLNSMRFGVGMLVFKKQIAKKDKWKKFLLKITAMWFDITRDHLMLLRQPLFQPIALQPHRDNTTVKCGCKYSVRNAFYSKYFPYLP
jgi:hypothetical protein